MKKIFLLILFLSFTGSPIFADNSKITNEKNLNLPAQTTPQKSNECQSSQSQQEWEQIYNQTINERYGSQESPAFLNRENIESVDDNDGFSGD